MGAALVAVLAAALLGVSGVAQRRGMSTPSSAGARRGLLAGLLTSAWWWIGTLASIGGLALQFLALTLGSLVVVQTTMVSSIAATTLAEWLLLGRRPGLGGWVGTALTVSGLVGILAALSPTTATAATPGAVAMAVLGGIGLAGVAVASLRARWRSGGGLLLAAATGLGYGITAVALKSVGVELASGWSAPLTHPAVWVATLLGPASVLLSQHALHRARRVAAAVSLIVVIDPVVGLLAGVTWFGERVATTPTALALAATSAAAVVAGIATTHGRSRTVGQEGEARDDADRPLDSVAR
jgi:hypothetical protein